MQRLMISWDDLDENECCGASPTFVSVFAKMSKAVGIKASECPHISERANGCLISKWLADGDGESHWRSSG